MMDQAVLVVLLPGQIPQSSTRAPALHSGSKRGKFEPPEVMPWACDATKLAIIDQAMRQRTSCQTVP